MTDYAQGNAVQMAELRQADADAAGYPVASDRSGPGYHSPFAPAVTRWVANTRQHPTNPAKFAYPVREGLAEQVAGRVPPGILVAIQNAAPLGPDWAPPGLDAVALGKNR